VTSEDIPAKVRELSGMPETNPEGMK